MEFLVFKAALLTINLEVISLMTSTSFKPFSFNVLPVATKSIIASQSPKEGAIYIDPLR